MSEDVAVEIENPVEEQNVNDNVVVEQDEPEVEAQSDEGGEVDETPELTPEQKLEEKARQAEALEKKVKRQTAAYNKLQEKLEQERKVREQLQKEQPQEELVEPKIEDFDTLEEYQKADREFVRKQAEREFESKIEQQRLQQEQMMVQAERTKVYEASRTDALQKYPDFQREEAEVNQFIGELAQNVRPETSRAFFDALYMGDNVADVVHYFGENSGERLDELQAISQMSPIKAAYEVFKIQQSIKANPAKAKKVETLPKPPQKVKATGVKKKDLSDGDVLKNLGLK